MKLRVSDWGHRGQGTSEMGDQEGGFLGTFWVPYYRLEDKVIPDVRYDVFLVLKSYPDHFMYIP